MYRSRSKSIILSECVSLTDRRIRTAQTHPSLRRSNVDKVKAVIVMGHGQVCIINLPRKSLQELGCKQGPFSPRSDNCPGCHLFGEPVSRSPHTFSVSRDLTHLPRAVPGRDRAPPHGDTVVPFQWPYVHIVSTANDRCTDQDYQAPEPASERYVSEAPPLETFKLTCTNIKNSRCIAFSRSKHMIDALRPWYKSS